MALAFSLYHIVPQGDPLSPLGVQFVMAWHKGATCKASASFLF